MNASRSFRSTLPLFVVALVAPVLAGGCASQPFPSELFTVEASHADYPVMLSKTPGSHRGRPISATSGVEESVSQSTYSSGNTQVTVTTTRSHRSELPASQKLASQIRRTDKWVQIHNVTFTAADFSTYGSSAAGRQLTIEGEVIK